MSDEFIIQLWAESYEAFKKDSNSFRLTPEEMKQLQQDNQEFERLLPYEQELIDNLDFGTIPDYWRWKTAAEIAQYATGGRASTSQVGKILNNWQRIKKFPIQRKRTREKIVFYVPAISNGYQW